MGLTTLAIGGLGLLGLGFLAFGDSGEAPEAEERELWLTTGTQYSLLIHEPNVSSLDDLGAMLTSLGFVVQSISPMPPGGVFQVMALWNQKNTLWRVPENVSISAV